MSNEIQHQDNDYLPCDQYHSYNIDDSGFYRFEQHGKYYFSFIDHGIVVLRSEGYSSESGRDNGIASVQKNMDNEEMYSTKMLPDGRWVLSLKAGNHQEIARSCPEASEEEVQSYLPSQRAAFAAEFLRLASIEAGSVPQEGVAFASDDDSSKESDDYMICREYEEKYSPEQVEEGNFIRFKHENTGSFYFAWVSENGEIIMRSEAYPTAGARDNGLESVRKNRDLEERYKIEEQRGLWYLILKAGNHQEIGRSCPFKSEDEAKAWLPSERAKAEALKLAALASSIPSSSEDDDYMICREYEEQFDTAKMEDGFIKFHHENTGKYYFAWYNDNGDVVLRSEGYPTTSARDNGLESVKKNREIRERFTVEEKRGLYYLILKAGNHQEIGRSCPKKSEDEVWALLAKPEAIADLTPLAAVAAAVPLVDLGSEDHSVSDAVSEVVAEELNVDVKVEDVAIAAPVVAAVASLASDFSKEKIEYKALDKADDYLACDEYKGHAVSDRTNNIAFFKHKDGQFYFVVYHKDGSVRLRSEGFKTAQQRDQELKGVIKHMNDEKMYETLEKGSHVFHILKYTTGREVARSCAEKPGAIVVPMAAAPAAVVAPPVAAEVPKAVATAAATTATTGSGFKWWYLLPLLLIPLFFMWKGCDGNKDEVSTTTPQTAPIQEAAPAPVEEATVAETTPVPAAPSCDLNWILFDFDKYDITSEANAELQVMAKILKENPTYKGILNAHTDSRGDDAYNQRLSENRANAAKSVLVQAGIDGGRITTTAKSEAAPIAQNTDDDTGRRFNRRVELFVVDADGKEICKSIPPNVPSELKTK